MKKQLTKLIPLILLYLSTMALLLMGSNYELIITITASVPLIVYMFNKNTKIDRILKYILYIFVATLLVYLINRLIWDYRWLQASQDIFHFESEWSALRWNQFFIYDLKYLIYIGIIFLAVRSKKYE